MDRNKPDTVDCDVEVSIVRQSMQNGRLDVVNEIKKILGPKQRRMEYFRTSLPEVPIENEWLMSEEEKKIWELVEGLSCRLGGVIGETAPLKPLFLDPTKNAETLDNISKRVGAEFELVYTNNPALDLLDGENVGPEKIKELEAKHGKQNLIMYTLDATTSNGEPTSIVLMFVRKK